MKYCVPVDLLRGFYCLEVSEVLTYSLISHLLGVFVALNAAAMFSFQHVAKHLQQFSKCYSYWLWY